VNLRYTRPALADLAEILDYIAHARHEAPDGSSVVFRR
jgi:plasmid stabilization system protein ParE